jgi:hypothetical protein
MLTATRLAVVLPLLLLPTIAASKPAGCVVVDSHGRCLVVAVDPGRPGGPRASHQGPLPGPARPRQNNAPVRSAAPPPPPPIGAVPGGGGWVVQTLPDPDDFLAALPGGGAPAPEPATTPQVLARQAIKRLSLPPPVLRTSIVGSGYVGVPVWLWIDDGAASVGPVSATATAGAATVTATGRLSAVEWSMGPPGAEVRCVGPGTPWTGQKGPSPDCGYTYELRSLPERTAGTGRWTVTATSVWTVTWSGTSNGAPVTGEETVRVPTLTSFPIGEIQVLVAGDGS